MSERYVKNTLWAQFVIRPKEFYSKLLDLEMKDSDILVTGFPKSGTYWTQEMTWLIGHNLDYEGGKKSIAERSPYLERSLYYDYDTVATKKNMSLPTYFTDPIKVFSEQESPRCGKINLPWHLLPKEIQDGTKRSKIIHVIRNPKDVCLSLYHYDKLATNTNLSFDEYCELFLSMSHLYWDNVLSYWKRQHEPNLLILRFEDMKKDLASVVPKVAEFLDKTITKEQIDALVKHLSFENMKDNKSVNLEEVINFRKESGDFKGKGSHMRSGAVNEHAKFMSKEMIEKFDKNIEDNGRDIFLKN